MSDRIFVLRRLKNALGACALTWIVFFSASTAVGQPTAGLPDGKAHVPAEQQLGTGGGLATAELEARLMVANSQSKFGREFAKARRMKGPERVQAYLRLTEKHRQNAIEVVQLAQAGPLPASADKQIREALKADLSAWREVFEVAGDVWQAMRDQWLVDRKSLTALQWAQQRAGWFAARDAWIALQLQRLQTQAERDSASPKAKGPA